MMNNFLDCVEITGCTESGIQIAKVKIDIYKGSDNYGSLGIIVPTKKEDERI